MINKQLVLGMGLVTAIFFASDARALTPYVAEGKDACASCGTHAGPSSRHRVGAFALSGVGADKSRVVECSGRYSLPKAPLIVAGPVILAGAIVNDAYLLLTMPYRETQRLN